MIIFFVSRNQPLVKTIDSDQLLSKMTDMQIVSAWERKKCDSDETGSEISLFPRADYNIFYHILIHHSVFSIVALGSKTRSLSL